MQENNLIFVREERNSIDLYVSTDGSETALSGNGIARMCGLHRSVIHDLAKSLTVASGKPAPKELECLRDKIYIASGYSIQGSMHNAKLINTKAAARIIRYYAYESKIANATARETYGKFAEDGLDLWIKTVTGFKPPVDMVELPLDTLEHMHRIIGDYIRDAKIVKNQVPGVGTLLTAYAQPTLAPENIPNPFLLRHFLALKVAKVDKALTHRFAQFLTGFYRGTSLEMPNKPKYLHGMNIGNSNVYEHSKLPLLDAAWENFNQIG